MDKKLKYFFQYFEIYSVIPENKILKFQTKLDYRKSLANLFCTIFIDKCLKMNSNQGLSFFKERNVIFSEKLDYRIRSANLAVLSIVIDKCFRINLNQGMCC